MSIYNYIEPLFYYDVLSYIMIAACIASIYRCAYYIMSTYFHVPQQTSTSASGTDFKATADRHQIAPKSIHRSTTKRHIFSEFGCMIYAWPSGGGVIIRPNADLVELKFLGLDPFNPPAERYADDIKEDAFCTMLRKIGGKWWPNEQRFIHVWFMDGIGEEPTAEELMVVFTGWPEGGGVLAVVYESENQVAEDMGRLRMAMAMEQRCEILRTHFGATLYEDPALCPSLASLSS